MTGRVPEQLLGEARELKIRPWKPTESAVLDSRVAETIAGRLSRQSAELVRKAERLHSSGEITDEGLQQVKLLSERWGAVSQSFRETAQALSNHDVAVKMDE
jgi:hypothetical protein